jgi:hypothetical protein
MLWSTTIRFRLLHTLRSLRSVLALALVTTASLVGASLVGGGIAQAATPTGGAMTGSTSATTWYVSAKAKKAPTCATASARKAFPTIAGALSCAQSGDTVKIGAGTFAGQFTLSANVTLEGDGANKTTIANPAATGSSLEVTIAPEVSATIADLTVDGEGTGADGLGGDAGISDGGASLVLDGVAVTGTFNYKEVTGPGIALAAVTVAPPSGTAAALTVVDSTLSDNFGYSAGGIVMDGTSSTALSSLEVVNSTVTGNEGAQIGAGGIALFDSSGTVRDDTITDNSGSNAGGLDVGDYSTATVTDTILAANTGTNSTTTPDCYHNDTAEVTSGGHNLIGVADPGSPEDCGFVNGVNGDLAGTLTSPLDPDLGSLAQNGGPTETQALLAGSPAIDAGNPADCEAAPVNDLDQRGDPRNATSRLTCDIGAYDTGGVTS